MKHKARTKAMSWLLSLALALSLTPGMSLTALAWDGDPYASLLNTTTVVKFDNKDWYLIENNSTALNAGTVTLLTKECVAASKYNSFFYVEYASSTVKTAVDNYYTNSISSNVKTAIVDAKMFLLTKDQANAMTAATRKCTKASGADENAWWLRSPGGDDECAACVLANLGSVSGDGSVNHTLGVRPALKLDLSSVIFSSESKTFTVGSATVDVTGVSLDKTTAQTIELDGKVSFTATVSPDNATDKTVKWSVGGTNVGAVKLYSNEACTIEVGTDATETLTVYAKGISAGSATVTATSNADSTKTASCAVTVNEAVGEKAYAAYDVTTETNKTKSGNDLTALQVTFNERQWYIIEDNSSSATSGTVTLLSADTSFGTKTFDEVNKSNKYSTSQVKAYLDSMTGTNGAFADVADAIETVNLTTNQYNSTAEYETVNGVKLYLLSTEEANSLPTNVRKAGFTGGDCGSNKEWWLRSPGFVGDNAVIVYGAAGNVYVTGYYVKKAFGVRPALKLDLSKVTFDSATKTFTMNAVVEEPSTYTLVIPSTLSVANSGWNATTGISATGTLASGKKLTVTATSGDEFALVNQSDDTQKVGYKLATASTDTAATTSWEFTELSSTATKKDMGIIVEDYSSKPAGTYQDTVTFTAKVEDAGNIVTLSTLTADYEAQSGDILTDTLAAPVKISIADGATVTLKDVNITNLEIGCDWAGINCPGNATLILNGTNTVCAGRDSDNYNNYPGIWIAPNKTLTIDGDGSLTAYSTDTNNACGAGIGGGYQVDCGNIVIKSGTITATGGGGAAGIGNGQSSSCGNITITGGTIDAVGGTYAAGIGSGYSASCGSITIANTVTRVTATAGNNSLYSIGAGYDSACGTVTIGDYVNAISMSPYTYPPQQ